MSGDLISREALKKAYFNAINETSIGEVSIIDLIDNAPAVDIESVKSELNPTVTCWYDFDRGYEKGYERGKSERPQGEWILNEGKLNNPICNQCGCKNDYVRNFCPVCGSDMKGGAE